MSLLIYFSDKSFSFNFIILRFWDYYPVNRRIFIRQDYKSTFESWSTTIIFCVHTKRQYSAYPTEKPSLSTNTSILQQSITLAFRSTFRKLYHSIKQILFIFTSIYSISSSQPTLMREIPPRCSSMQFSDGEIASKHVLVFYFFKFSSHGLYNSYFHWTLVRLHIPSLKNDSFISYWVTARCKGIISKHPLLKFFSHSHVSMDCDTMNTSYMHRSKIPIFKHSFT